MQKYFIYFFFQERFAAPDASSAERNSLQLLITAGIVSVAKNSFLLHLTSRYKYPMLCHTTPSVSGPGLIDVVIKAHPFLPNMEQF